MDTLNISGLLTYNTWWGKGGESQNEWLYFTAVAINSLILLCQICLIYALDVFLFGNCTVDYFKFSNRLRLNDNKFLCYSENCV